MRTHRPGAPSDHVGGRGSGCTGCRRRTCSAPAGAPSRWPRGGRARGRRRRAADHPARISASARAPRRPRRPGHGHGDERDGQRCHRHEVAAQVAHRAGPVVGRGHGQVVHRGRGQHDREAAGTAQHQTGHRQHEERDVGQDAVARVEKDPQEPLPHPRGRHPTRPPRQEERVRADASGDGEVVEGGQVEAHRLRDEERRQPAPLVIPNLEPAVARRLGKGPRRTRVREGRKAPA